MDKGVKMLCGIPSPANPQTTYNGCKNLEELDVRCTGVTREGLRCALSLLPKIKTLFHHDIDQAAIHLTEPIELENMTFSSISSEKSVEMICDKVPKITKLELNCRIDNFEPLEKLTNVKKLIIHNKDFQCEQVIPLIKCYSKKLTKLELGVGTVDVSLIGWHCLNLEKLIWNCEAARECEYELTQEHFSKLRTIRISFYDDHSQFPASGLKSLLSCSCLEVIEIENLTIPEGVLETLVTEAKTGSGVFSQLKRLELTFCNKLTLESIQSIICLAPKLTHLDILASLGPPSAWKYLIQFIKYYAPYIFVPFNHTPPEGTV